MRREIIFRGKHIHILPGNEHLDGIWVYGYLCDENYINTVDEDEYGGKFTSEKLIDPETICQYTGLKDKNGKKIFEGDILSAYLDSEIDEKTYAQVTWNGFSWCIRERSRDDVMTEWDCKHFEVCGNIFDNPEFILEKTIIKGF